LKEKSSNDLIEKISTTINKGMKEADVPGVSIAIVKKDKILWSKGYGFTDRTQTKRVDSDTLFWIGSLSKAYTATAFFRAAQKGLVRLDDPIRKYYPEFTWNSIFGENEKDMITFRHLLAHRAGLQHFTKMTDPKTGLYYSFEEYISKISESWQKYPVGELHSYSYSNAGYDLIAFILQKITGKKFEDWMNDEVYKPLGMNNSFVGTSNVLKKENWARGHVGKLQYQSEKYINPNLGAGAQYSSVNDMSKFIQMHLNKGHVKGKEFLTKESLQELYSIPFPEKNQLVTIGLGMGVNKMKYGGELMLSFMGDGDGCFAMHQIFPNLGFGLLAETNQIQNTYPLLFELSSLVFDTLIEENLGNIPLDLTVNDKFNLPQTITLDKSILHRLEGKYISRMMDIAIELKDGKLTFDFRGKEVELSPRSNTIFSSELTPYVEFYLDEENRPSKVKVITSDGRVAQFDYDSGPADKLGPNKKEWNKLSKIYYYDYLDFCMYSTTTTIKNGYLHLITSLGNKDFLLKEYKPNIFFTVDGQNVIFKDNQIELPSIIWKEDDISIDKIRRLLLEDPKNKKVTKVNLEEILFVFEASNQTYNTKTLKEIIAKYYPEKEKEI